MMVTRRLIGLYTKLENSSGDYIKYKNEGPNAGAFRYYDALQIFKKTVTAKKDVIRTKEKNMWDSYMNRLNKDQKGYSSYEGKFKNELKSIGVSDSEIESVWTYIFDTLISAKTEIHPELNEFVLDDIDSLPANGKFLKYRYLYIKSQDQSRNVDFGLVLRQNADLWLSKDLYKTTMLVNGKKEEYFYNKKKSETDSNGNWTLNLRTGDYAFSNGSDGKNRASNKDYIGEDYGGNTYTREVRKSEYLYNAGDVETDNIKNLQVFVTYRIAIKNQSQTIPTRVDEIVDYYDSDQYSYVKGNTITKDNTFIGDKKGNKTKNLKVSEKSIYPNIGYNIIGEENYDALYLTGLKGYLQPGELTYVYITFKVNNDASGKVKLDQEMEDLLNLDPSKGNKVRDTVGKRNIAEINGYSTKEGLIDLDSNAGSLRPKDLDKNGDIISSDDESINRLEDDTDKAGNLKLKIDTNDDDIRKFSGYVFEDARTEVSDEAVIGNGRYDESDEDFEGNKDKKVNGVTVQLVELVQKVDEEGFATGSYEREHIWASVTYGKSGNTWNKTEDTSRYYSGTKKSKVILSGPGVFEVKPTDLTEGAGEYKYESLPPGDFFIRFIYGDTTQTVLTNGTEESDEVQKLFNENSGLAQSAVDDSSYKEGMLETKGLNDKSYTGQDYKSTIYQREVNQDPSVNKHDYRAKDGEIKENGIYGFTDRENQNYGIQGQDFNYSTNDTINDDDKAKMYNYSIEESDKIDHTISDAKDVYSYREREQKYSSGSELSYLSER